MVGPSEADWMRLADAAWKAREHAHLVGTTRVGSAVTDEEGRIHVGCNVEHRFRSHDIHAEVNAIGSMVTNGGHRLLAILVVAERNSFTPCGSCMDWIMEFGGPDCAVGFQGSLGGRLATWKASELMPFYPS
jgi:cytidine deaminase